MAYLKPLEISHILPIFWAVHYDSIYMVVVDYPKEVKMYPVKNVICSRVTKNDNVSPNCICINEQPEVVFIQCTCAFPERNNGNNRKLQLTATNREINPEFIFCFNVCVT